ncbi:MAG: adenylate/guanylate cyclase domain-containing protein [Pseudomonadota bacterium]
MLGRIVGLERFIGLMLLAFFVVLRGWDPAPLEIARLKIFDFYQIAKPRQPTDYPVVIVDIDDSSLERLGQWPWPRDLIAKIVDAVAANGGKAVAFDVLFSEPDRMSPALIASRLVSIDQTTRQRLKQLPTNEQILAKSFAKLPVVVGEAGTISPPIGQKTVEGDRASIATLGGDPKPYLIAFPRLVRNMPRLTKAAAGHGLFSIRPDRDGIIRRVATVMSVGDQLVPSLAMELIRVSQPKATMLVKRDEAGVQGVSIGKTSVATDRNGQLWVYFSKRRPNRYVSAADVLGGTLEPDQLRDKLVLVGTSAAGLFDLRATPLDRVMPGVEIHAQQIEAILTGALLTRPHYALGAEIAMAILVGVLIIVLAPMLGALPVLALGAVVAASLISLSWYLFDQEKILLDVAYPLLSSFLIFLVLTYVNYFREEMQRNRIRTAFSQYLSPDLVSQLTRDPNRLVLGGETRNLSVLFSDVRGFTSIAESYRDNPAELTTLMNRLLTPLSNAIMDRSGTIDKYMGDAVMAFWNAPLDDPDHPMHAGESALAMSDEVRALNSELRHEDDTAGREHRPMRLGIGIATGSGVVGNMGSAVRFDYSVLGDTVNLASRLEGLTAQLLVPNLISDATAHAVDGRLAVIEVDVVRVKGKNEPERVHTIVGDSAIVAEPAFQQFKRLFTSFLSAYRNQNFDEAMQIHAEIGPLATQFGIPGILEIYKERIEGYRITPPEPNWAGVFNAEQK